VITPATAATVATGSEAGALRASTMPQATIRNPSNITIRLSQKICPHEAKKDA
jgi:hypothetical protein